MDAELKYRVDQFDGANFAVWARRIESIFVTKNLDKFLIKEADETKESEVSASKKAYALMLSLLSDKVLVSLLDENTCASIFQKLKSTYLKDGAVNQILIRKHLAMLKNKEVSMREHLNEVNGLVNQLKSCSVKISDVDIIVYILMPLPSEYDSTKSAIENQPSEYISLQFVVGRLLDAEALLKDRRVSETKAPTSESSNDIAFSTIQRTVVCFRCNKRGHIARFCDKTVACHHCGKFGHKKRNCRNLTRKKPPFKEEAAAVSFVVGEGEVKKFIVDSGALSHMCSQREWSEELKPSSGTVSCAAKSSLLEVAGTGVIRGRLKNGQEIVLTNVLFIPKLNGNLISVKQIQKIGYSVHFKDNKAIVKGKNKTFVLCELYSKGQYVSDLIPTVSNTFVLNFGLAD
ncbi:Copia protein [Araneus ventricosus]|uniref:Copia protein n=1 Tax=Araneus ventricosus TaxID=182803 RepID=A0A4Y2UP71_ARAVE|nr:Copia protein [Araneus ventricosus]GBO14052.1 Copia protein [Araneus ventricosus]